jgi:hypothetical protein
MRLHFISKIEVYSSYNLGYPMGTFLSRAEEIAKKIEVWFYASKGLVEMKESGNKKNRIEVHVADPNLIIKKQALQKRVTGTQNPFEEIFKYNELSGLG